MDYKDKTGNMLNDWKKGNYGHLFSFSLVNLLTHGRACALVNPYATVFFSSAIEPQLKMVGKILSQAGYIDEDVEKFSGSKLIKCIRLKNDHGTNTCLFRTTSWVEISEPYFSTIYNHSLSSLIKPLA